MTMKTKMQIMAPVIRGRKGEHQKVFEDARRSGYVRARVDGNLYDLSEEATDPEEEKWHGSINLSGSVTRGNTIGESATIVADASRRWEYDRLTTDLGYYFAQSGSSKDNKQKTDSRFEAQAQEDHFWTGKGFYNYVNGKYEFDRIMDLMYRWRLGVGCDDAEGSWP